MHNNDTKKVKRKTIYTGFPQLPYLIGVRVWRKPLWTIPFTLLSVQTNLARVQSKKKKPTRHITIYCRAPLIVMWFSDSNMNTTFFFFFFYYFLYFFTSIILLLLFFLLLENFHMNCHCSQKSYRINKLIKLMIMGRNLL